MKQQPRSHESTTVKVDAALRVPILTGILVVENEVNVAATVGVMVLAMVDATTVVPDIIAEHS